MKDLWGSGPIGRIVVNFIYGISILIAIYLLYIAYKKILLLIKGPEKIKTTVSYASVYDLANPYATGMIQFGIEIPEKMNVLFQIVNRDDEVLAVLHEGELEAKSHPIHFDTTTLPDGEYYYQLIGPHQKNTKKFFIVNNQKINKIE